MTNECVGRPQGKLADYRSLPFFPPLPTSLLPLFISSSLPSLSLWRRRLNVGISEPADNAHYWEREMIGVMFLLH